MNLRGKVNGTDAVIDLNAGKYVLVTGNMRVVETMSGEMFVKPGIGEPEPKEQTLTASDQVEIHTPSSHLYFRKETNFSDKPFQK